MQLGKAPRRDGRSTRTCEEGPIGMRLASRIFLAISVVILVLVVVAGWSLLAMNQIVALNRSLVTQTAPALRLEAALRESMPALVRLETRYAILHDAGYESLWKARAARVSQDFDQLHGLLLTRQETKLHLKAVAEFAMYQSLVGSLGSGVDRRTAAVSGLEPRLAATRTERALDRLQDATHASLEHSEQRARRLERRTWHAVMIALPASVVLALLGAGVIAVRMTRSLRRLSVATTQVVEGSFVAPVGVEGRDEIGRLAQAFNRMGERLREADRMKEEFFSHISHELRTPLTSVREAATLLRDEVPGVLAPKQARLVEIIAASTDRVLRLVNEILELSRLRAGLLAIDRRNVDVGNLVHRALEQVRPQAEARGLHMESNGAIDGARRRSSWWDSWGAARSRGEGSGSSRPALRRPSDWSHRRTTSRARTRPAKPAISTCAPCATSRTIRWHRARSTAWVSCASIQRVRSATTPSRGRFSAGWRPAIRRARGPRRPVRGTQC